MTNLPGILFSPATIWQKSNLFTVKGVSPQGACTQVLKASSTYDTPTH
jgi:hypothetical protein